MALVNILTPGLPDDAINRNLGMTPTGTYNIGITANDVSGSPLTAAPLNVACQGFMATGVIVTSLAGSPATTVCPNNIGTYIIANGSVQGSCTIYLPGAPMQGQKITLACAENGITAVSVQGFGASPPTVFGGISSLTAGQFATYQYFLIGSSQYWCRVG